MKKIYRIYATHTSKKGNTKITCLDNHYLTIIETYNYINVIPQYEFSTWTPEKNEFIIPSFLTEDDAIDFMVKYKIIGIVAPTVEKE